MPEIIEKALAVSEAAAAEAKSTGRMLTQLISPGWGSSGYYSSEVLEQAVIDQVIPAGTHMYADHPTEAEAQARPGRSIKDLMSVTTEPARLATEDDVARGAEIGALVAEIDVVPTYRPLVEHLKDAIGVSIRGDGELVEGTAEGRTGKIVESLAHVQSVDWVTRAGRGGKVLSLVESAKATRRAVSRGVSEATANDTRDALQTVLRDAYATQVANGPSTWIWVRDFDETTVWFEVDGPGDDAGLFGQTYTQDTAGAVSLTGARAEVRVVTKYVPATRPDSTIPTTEDDQEVTMGKISIEESEHSTLTEKAGRVDALQEENATLKAKNQELEEAAATATRTSRATELVAERAKEADVAFSLLEQAGLMAALPLKDGALDEETFTKRVDEHAATKKAAIGAGKVTGFGGQVSSGAPLGESADFWDQIDSKLDISKGA